MKSYARVRLRGGALLALTIAAGAALCEQPAGTVPRPITVSSDEQARLGVATQPLSSSAAPPRVTTTARVLDPGPLIQLDAELAAAAASLAASRAEAARTRRLYSEDRTASERAVQAAEAQARADQERVSGAQRRLLLEWGDGVAALTPQRRAALLNDLAHVRAELVRVELPAEAPLPQRGAIIRLRSSEAAAVIEAKVLGLLPVADPRLQTRGVLAELSGKQATLAVGQMLSAELPAAESGRGVVLPRDALLRKDAQVWVYVQTGPTRFERRAVSGYQPSAAGWFVASGFSPGERIVTVGAAALLGVEAPAGDSGD